MTENNSSYVQSEEKESLPFEPEILATLTIRDTIELALSAAHQMAAQQGNTRENALTVTKLQEALMWHEKDVEENSRPHFEYALIKQDEDEFSEDDLPESWTFASEDEEEAAEEEVFDPDAESEEEDADQGRSDGGR